MVVRLYAYNPFRPLGKEKVAVYGSFHPHKLLRIRPLVGNSPAAFHLTYPISFVPWDPGIVCGVHTQRAPACTNNT
jgi:hypothetical protein